jgi:hypothetical protein
MLQLASDLRAKLSSIVIIAIICNIWKGAECHCVQWGLHSPLMLIHQADKDLCLWTHRLRNQEHHDRLLLWSHVLCNQT